MARFGAPRLAALLLLAGAPAAAQTVCAAPGPDDAGVVLARVREGTHRAPLHRPCGTGGARMCAGPAYLLPGDTVLVHGHVAGWDCVTYATTRRTTSGWLPAGRVEALRVAAPAMAAWRGDWERVLSSLELRPAGRQLAVAGDATWYGAPHPDGERSVHIGEVHARATPRGDRWQGEDDLCRLRLRLLPPYLLAADNDQCGGYNVTFSGIYRRATRR